MGQEKLILHQNKTIFWQQTSRFHSCEDDCYQNCKVIVTKNLRWNYHLAMEEKWPNYWDMAAQYWMSHQYCLAFYFWWRSALRAIHTLNLPPKYIHKLGGLLPIHSMHRRRAQGLMWGAKGPFPLAAAMVVAVVMPVVFCNKATETFNKNTKTCCL